MQLCNVHKSQHRSHSEPGFNLLEILVVVSIVGILAAIAIPSVAAMHNRQKLNNAVEIVVGSLRAAQQQAIASHQRCQITLDHQRAMIRGGSAQNCLVNGDQQLPSGISLHYIGNDDTIAYGIKGNTTDNRTILLNIQNISAPAKCVVVSAPIGILRRGTYDLDKQLCISKP